MQPIDIRLKRRYLRHQDAKHVTKSNRAGTSGKRSQSRQLTPAERAEKDLARQTQPKMLMVISSNGKKRMVRVD